MRIFVLGSESSNGNDPHHRRAAERLGRAITQHGATLVFGGTKGGLIATAAAAALAEGGSVIGVVPRDHAGDWAHLIDHSVTELVWTDSVAARQTYMFERCDAAAAVPGGHGTLYEFFQITTGAKNHEHEKPLGILNTRGYYDAILGQLQVGKDQGFIDADLSPFLVDSSPERLVELLIQRVLAAAARAEAAAGRRDA